jgi:hypothetical protein
LRWTFVGSLPTDPDMFTRNVIIALMFIACGAPPEQNTQFSKPSAQAPTAAQLPATPDGFVLGNERLELRPFAVRLALIATLVGVTTDHPLLEDLRVNHIELGDYDYAAGVQPGLVWTAQKLALWTESLRPVCRSYEFRARFPGFPSYLETFVLAAFGRPADAFDTLALEEAFADLNLSDNERAEAACLALLGSTELVLK